MKQTLYRKTGTDEYWFSIRLKEKLYKIKVLRVKYRKKRTERLNKHLKVLFIYSFFLGSMDICCKKVFQENTQVYWEENLIKVYLLKNKQKFL